MLRFSLMFLYIVDFQISYEEIRSLFKFGKNGAYKYRSSGCHALAYIGDSHFLPTQTDLYNFIKKVFSLFVLFCFLWLTDSQKIWVPMQSSGQCTKTLKIFRSIFLHLVWHFQNGKGYRQLLDYLFRAW